MSMVKMTVEQCWDLGLWDKYCEWSGCNPYAINEGQIEKQDIIEFDSEFKKENIVDENVIEFNLSGSVYTGKDKIDLDDLNKVFLDMLESKGWTFCGIIAPLDDKK